MYGYETGWHSVVFILRLMHIVFNLILLRFNNNRFFDKLFMLIMLLGTRIAIRQSALWRFTIDGGVECVTGSRGFLMCFARIYIIFVIGDMCRYAAGVVRLFGG